MESWSLYLVVPVMITVVTSLQSGFLIFFSLKFNIWFVYLRIPLSRLEPQIHISPESRPSHSLLEVVGLQNSLIDPQLPMLFF